MKLHTILWLVYMKREEAGGDSAGAAMRGLLMDEPFSGRIAPGQQAPAQLG